MKIAYIVNQFPLISETFILNQICGMIDLGHEIEIFALENKFCDRVHEKVFTYNLFEKTKYITIPSKKHNLRKKALKTLFKIFAKNPLKTLKILIALFHSGFSYKTFFFAASFINKKFDIIHCHFGPNGNIGVFLKKSGHKSKIITSFHGYDIHCIKNAKDYYKQLSAYGDIFTANTKFTKSKILKFGFPEDKIEILPVGIDNDIFKFQKRSENDFIKILSVGRLVEKKGHIYAIEAIKKLKQIHPKIDYNIIGAGPLEKKLKELTVTNNLQKTIHFLGEMNQEEILRYYYYSDIFLLPCVTASNGDMEGQCLVIQEAQATGLPVISTFHNGIPEGLIDNKTGFLVKEKDIDGLFRKLSFLIENPKTRLEMGINGNIFTRKYDLKKLNDRLFQIYFSA